MADIPELAPEADDHGLGSSSSDEETIRGERDEDYVAEAAILEEEEENRPADAPIPTVEVDTSASIPNHYRGIVGASQETASEDGSTDAIPRLAASPMGSNLSIPDDTPSAQVRF